MTTLHNIGGSSGIYGVDWKGDPPAQAGEVVEVHNIPGQDGLGFQLLGKAGDQFTAELTCHLGGTDPDTSLPYTPGALAAYCQTIMQTAQGLREDDAVEVTWCGVQMYDEFGYKYKVLAVKILEARAAIRIVGPGYDYSPAFVLRIQFTMRPVNVGVPDPPIV